MRGSLRSGAILWTVINPVSRTLARLWPPTHEESLSQLKYINQINFNDINNASTLIEQEQARLLQRAPRFFDHLRQEIASSDKIDPKILYEANRSIHKEIERQISECAKLNLSVKQSECLLHRHSIQIWISSLDKNLYELMDVLKKAQHQNLSQLYTNEIISTLDEIMGTACQSVASEDPISISQLIEMTERPDATINQFKPKHLASDDKIDTLTKKTLLGMAFYYERIIWITNKLAHALASDQEETVKDFSFDGDVETQEPTLTNLAPTAPYMQ